MTSNSNVISVEHLSKYYGEKIGIKDISFTVSSGELFGFLGPNGAGKTSTIRSLLDMQRPTSGRIEIFGRPVRKHSKSIRKRCGYLPGNFSIYGDMSGFDFLSFAAAMRKADPSGQKDLIDRFHLSTADLSKRIKQYSHGMMQKLGIIQAFFHHPELFILDEPTIGLDPLMQEEFYTLIREKQAEGKTIFFSSHNLPEVEKMCNQIAIIRKGEMVALETLDALKKKKKRRLKFTLNKPVSDLLLPGAILLSRQDNAYEYLIQGDIPPLLNALAKLPIEELLLPEPHLEDVFMAYYQKEEAR